jgi:peptide/nickel transport system substrate-binding protein
VTFHLARPDPDLPLKLALPPAFPVPVATPAEDQRLEPLPATGPYMISEADADGLELVRNPEFREWSGAAQPDGFVDAISWRFGEELATAFDRLSEGKLDWMTDRPTQEDLASLQTAHPDQVVFSNFPATFYIGFHLSTPPFDNARVRQAINYAIDRDRVVELLGGAASYQPTCQVLPPNFQGYEPFCPYTLEPNSGVWSAPDPDRARALIEDADAVGEKVTVWVTDADLPGGVASMRHLVEVMNEIGLAATLKVEHNLDRYVGAVYGGKAQAYLFGWIPGYPGAGDFIPPQFRCGADANASGLCDERLDAAIDEAQRLQATDPAASNSAWTEIEHQLVDDAIWAPLTNSISAYAFSARTDNVQIHPVWGILLSRLWVQ